MHFKQSGGPSSLKVEVSLATRRQNPTGFQAITSSALRALLAAAILLDFKSHELPGE
jgi:hypothetical protein